MAAQRFVILIRHASREVLWDMMKTAIHCGLAGDHGWTRADAVGVGFRHHTHGTDDSARRSSSDELNAAAAALLTELKDKVRSELDVAKSFLGALG
jgi:hypothetical protein